MKASERSSCSSKGICRVVVAVFLLGAMIVIFSKPWKTQSNFQPSNCASECPSSDNCTVSAYGTVTCNTTDDYYSFSSSVRVASTAGDWSWTPLMITAIVLCLLLGFCCCFISVIRGQQRDRNLQNILLRTVYHDSHLTDVKGSWATDKLRATSFDDEDAHVECDAADEQQELLPTSKTQLCNTAGHLRPQVRSVEQRHQFDFGRPDLGNAARPMYETERHREFGLGQHSHSSRPRLDSRQPLTDLLPCVSTHLQVQTARSLSPTDLDDTANHTTVARSLAVVPDGANPLSRRHGPTDSSHRIAAYNPAEPPVRTPRPSTARSERSILFTPEIIVVPAEIMMSSNASKLFRRCARLHDHLESLMELDIISPQLCCQVTAECQSHGNMSGLALLYRQVKQAGNEVRFLAELRAQREEMAICTSSIGSDEAGRAASRLSEAATSSQSAISLDCASVTSLLNSHETLMWVQALDNLEDLIYEGILTVYQYAYIVDLALHDWQISALMQIVNGCRKQARLQRFLATPPTTTMPPRRGSPHGAATAAGAGRNPQQ